MAQIHQLLKQKLQELKPDDYALSKTFSEDELTQLDEVARDESAELDDRIIASRAMVNIAENRLIRAQRTVNHFKSIWSALEHKKQEERNINATTNEVLKRMGNADGVEDTLARLLEMIRAKKEGR